MKYDKMTVKVQEAVEEAGSLAQEYNHSALEPIHLLKALLEQEEGVIPP